MGMQRDRFAFQGSKVRAQVDADAFSYIDEERRIHISFSSETQAVRRMDPFFGAVVPEVLIHREGSVDLSPFLEVGAVLRNHDLNQIIGRPISAGVDLASRRGTAVIEIGRTPKANEAWQEVLDRSLKGVSVGYDVQKTEKIYGDETRYGVRGPAVLVTKWRVLEISLTPIPADFGVGVGRSALAGRYRVYGAVVRTRMWKP
jgi:HK97 family phage prohead protease